MGVEGAFASPKIILIIESIFRGIIWIIRRCFVVGDGGTVLEPSHDIGKCLVPISLKLSGEFVQCIIIHLEFHEYTITPTPKARVTGLVV